MRWLFPGALKAIYRQTDPCRQTPFIGIVISVSLQQTSDAARGVSVCPVNGENNCFTPQLIERIMWITFHTNLENF